MIATFAGSVLVGAGLVLIADSRGLNPLGWLAGLVGFWLLYLGSTTA